MTGAKIVTSTDGTDIAWYDFGGSGPDVLLGHASGFCATMWAEVVDELRPHFRCVGYDSRGHGRSGRPTNPDIERAWDWERFADDAAAVIDAAGLDRPFGIGHSSGGATQLLLQERTAQSFTALYLFEPVIFPGDPPRGPWPDRELAVRTRRRRPSFASADDAYETFRTKGPFTGLTDIALRRYITDGFAEQTDGSVVLRCNPDDEAEVYAMATAHDGYRRLGLLVLPMTFAHGEHSTSFSKAEVKRLASLPANATFAEFDGLGHFGPLESPARFAAEAMSFFLPN